jgi:hypothetical protein
LPLVDDIILKFGDAAAVGGVDGDALGTLC